MKRHEERGSEMEGQVQLKPMRLSGCKGAVEIAKCKTKFRFWKECFCGGKIKAVILG
ncbi:hypothetical protein [Hymenobacter gummosus]|uniref:hypothetical protein n=1 Tax=Hymenobacter gummosus TaxID=1776032 RepID=UPI001404F89A|nr:hypothetical protein [Hymenobacter gummosus]